MTSISIKRSPITTWRSLSITIILRTRWCIPGILTRFKKRILSIRSLGLFPKDLRKERVSLRPSLCRGSLEGIRYLECVIRRRLGLTVEVITRLMMTFKLMLSQLDQNRAQTDWVNKLSRQRKFSLKTTRLELNNLRKSFLSTNLCSNLSQKPMHTWLKNAQETEKIPLK